MFFARRPSDARLSRLLADTRAIVAFSRARHPLARLGGPVAPWQQARATQGYLDALAASVRAATT